MKESEMGIVAPSYPAFGADLCPITCEENVSKPDMMKLMEACGAANAGCEIIAGTNPVEVTKTQWQHLLAVNGIEYSVYISKSAPLHFFQTDKPWVFADSQPADSRRWCGQTAHTTGARDAILLEHAAQRPPSRATLDSGVEVDAIFRHYETAC
ncbi:hypothetical protein AC578_9893 [Pseudocercospora eumusae]|uniref:Uncharacterized protein n=1 Tax=Pseudocercospora eumusae TaxID=321146 RepID=A0A139HAZ6_9PEZI|nr:hypothetical protein AC578_9893 [Pseudocercospora eumusae]